jgi:hypothetical protein
MIVDHEMILSGGLFSRTTRSDLAEIFRKFNADPQRDRLVLHFHGGLVSEAAGGATAERLLPYYRQSGSAYPLFTIWQSGLLETAQGMLRETAQLEAFPLLTQRVAQYVIGLLNRTEGQRGGDTVELPTIQNIRAGIAAAPIGREPLGDREGELAKLPEELSEAQVAQLIEKFEEDDRIAKGAESLAAGAVATGSDALKADLAQARAERNEGTKSVLGTGFLVRAGLRIVARCLRRYNKGSHHGLYTTVVEETVREIKGDVIGRTIWGRMKQNTLSAFAGPAETHGGSALLEEIAKLERPRPRILLVGHSAGAIYVCHLLQAVQERNLPADLTFEVVLLAAACSFDLLAETLRVAKERIVRLRLFAMRDSLEIADQLLPPIYNRSLLYFVSGLAEDDVDLPLVGMERYHKEPFVSRKAIRSVLDAAAAHTNAWIWSRAEGGLGLATLSTSHGDFDDDPQTLASVVHLVATGAYT